MFLWCFLFVFSTVNSPSTIPVAKVIAPPAGKIPLGVGLPIVEESILSPAEQKADVKTRQFLEAIDKLGNTQGANSSGVKQDVEIVQGTFQDLLTITTSDLRSKPEMYEVQRVARQIMNFVLMVIFVEKPEVAEKLIVLLTTNQTDPEVAKQLVEAFNSADARANMHAMLHSQEDVGKASQKASKFNRAQRAGFEDKVRDFYTELYTLKPEVLQASKNNFNRNVAIGALALTIVGVVASVALGATLIGLPAALGLLASTIGGPGSMAVQAWQKHQTDQLIQQAAPTMDASFKAILVTLEQLKRQIEMLQKQINEKEGPVSRAKQFFGMS
ncbi:MAG: hypothetical protein AAB323_01590 [Pseudomonadota bacterium]